MKKIFILMGNPNKEATLTNALADAYEKSAKEAGHEVRRTNLVDMVFDPILHKGYKVIQAYEPDLVKFQEDVKWAEHFVIIYPTWWSSMPGLLKCLFDRVWMPGFAFNFKKNGMGWIRRLKGRSARVIVTSNTPPILLRLLFGTAHNELRFGILWFSGFSVATTRFSGMVGLKPEKAQKFIAKVSNLGKRGK